MEYLRVTAMNRNTDIGCVYGIPVLINGEKNGETGAVIKLNSGKITISVDYVGSESVSITLSDTSFEHPMEIELMVGDDDEDYEKGFVS